MCVESSNHEVFLLGSAALANMTFMDSLACDYLSQYNTAAVLIEACHLDKTSSVFAKDQVYYSMFHFPRKGTNGLENEGNIPDFLFWLD